MALTYINKEQSARRVGEKLQPEVLSSSSSSSSGESLMSGALAMALTYINKEQSARRVGEKLQPRILAISATGDTAAHYMNYMNTFFTAQKLGVPVDTCMVLQDSGLLQQGSDITGG